MRKNNVKQLRVLILGEPDGGGDLTRWLGANTHVERVDTFEEAMQALRDAPFDVVLSRAADFIPFQDVHCSGQAAAIIESVTQGVCIVGQEGTLVWANPKMLNFADDVRERVCRCCMETFTWARTEVEAGSSEVRGRRFSFTTKDGEHFDVTATPVIDLHNRVTQTAAVVRDVTRSRQLQNKIDAIDQAGRELIRLDIEQISRLDTEDRLALLEQKILRCTKELLHFDNFEIRVLDKKTNRLEQVLGFGLPDSAHALALEASVEGNDICGYVAARGRSYICPDVAADPRYRPGLDHACSSLTVPLFLHDTVVGVANFESTKLAAFNEDDRQFAEIFGRYIALSLHVLELLVTERRTTTGRLGSDVMAGITGPLNDILTDVETLVEDYIGHDDLRHRLRKLSENAVRIRESIKDLIATKPGITGVHPSSPARRDPALTGKRILIADDEDIIRDTVRDVLAGYGCEVVTADDGAAAIDYINEPASGGFDLVLSDIKMPLKSGYEVFAAAKDANPDTPVILTTGFGYDPNHSIVRARREGLAAVLFKPFKVDQLLNEVRMALRAMVKK